MDFTFQTNIGSIKEHRLTTTKEISGYRQENGLGVVWNRKGLIFTHCVLKGITVTAATYNDVLETKFPTALQEKRPEKTVAETLS